MISTSKKNKAFLFIQSHLLSILLVYTAIANWQNNTCLIFNELPVITSTTNRSYIRFERDDQFGCSSPVGYDRNDPTSIIYLAIGCGSVSIRLAKDDKTALNRI